MDMGSVVVRVLVYGVTLKASGHPGSLCCLLSAVPGILTLRLCFLSRLNSRSLDIQLEPRNKTSWRLPKSLHLKLAESSVRVLLLPRADKRKPS